jgi:intein/homing endonuclease/DNA-binding XRE family transcriptional regulator/predicted phosphodiesterase
MARKYDWDQVVKQAREKALECQTIAELADAIGVNRKTLSDILKNRGETLESLVTAAAQESTTGVRVLQQKARHYQTLASRYEQQLTDRAWLEEEVAGLVATRKPVPVPKLPKKDTPYHEQIPILEFSDPHYGLEVEEGQLGVFGRFNSQMAEARTLYTFKTFPRLSKQLPFPIRRCKVYLLGDIVENSNMRPSQAKQTDAHVVKQTIHAADAISSGLQFLCSEFEQVDVEAVPGNHGRTTQKAGDNLPDETFDHLVYYIIKKTLADQPNFNINIHKAWYFIDDIFGWKFLGLHCEDVLCFMPGTPITLSDWTSKAIEEVKIGDMVLCHDGQCRHVMNVHERHHSGKMVVISTSMLPTPTIVATPNHEVPVVFSSQVCCPHHVNRVSKGRRCSQAYCGHDFTVPEIQWVPVSHVSPSDYLVVPTPRQDEAIDMYITRDLLPMMPEKLHPREKAIPESVPVDEKLGLLIGQYLADGNCAGKSEKWGHQFHTDLEICFHEDEEEFWLDAMDAFEHVFGFPGRLINRTNMSKRAQRVQFSSRRASAFVGALAGHGAKTKKVHESVLHWPIPALKALLIGYLRGDGHTARKKYHGRYHTQRVVATTVDVNLGWQLFWIARRCGYSPAIKVRDRSGSLEVSLSFYGDDARELGPLTQRNYIGEGDAEARRQQRANSIDCGDFMLVRVEAAYQVDYDGPTYDLTINDKHTYTANGVSVHNSYVGVPWYGIERAVKDYYMMLGQVSLAELRAMEPTTELAVEQFLSMLKLPDYVCVGHFHNRIAWDCMGVEVLANGALSGASIYGTKRRRRLNEPQQLMFLVHPERGVGWRCPIDLSMIK